MHKIISVLKHRGFITSSITNHNVKIDNSYVNIQRNADILTISISTKRKNPEAIKQLNIETMYILFLALGSFPEIMSIKLDEEEYNLNNLVGLYTSSLEYHNSVYKLVPIDTALFTQKSIDALRSINRNSLLSFAYIKSKDYEKVVANHRTTLLFHVIEGISTLTESELSRAKQELRNRYSVPANITLGNYLAIVYDLAKRYFFLLHRKYNCEILQQLHCNQFEFLQTVSDTRNQYSHLRINKSKHLTNGRIMQYYNEIVSLMIRLNVLERIHIDVDSNSVRELLYSLHDWIVETTKGKCTVPKSNNYFMYNQMENSLKMMENEREQNNVCSEGM